MIAKVVFVGDGKVIVAGKLGLCVSILGVVSGDGVRGISDEIVELTGVRSPCVLLDLLTTAIVGVNSEGDTNTESCENRCVSALGSMLELQATIIRSENSNMTIVSN